MVAASLAAARPAPCEGGVGVIAPGHEELLSDMLGKGVELPGGCKWAGAKVEHTIVIARYACAAGEITLELRHPDVAPADAVRTERFAIVPRGALPPGFSDALAGRIRARESAFPWGRAESSLDAPPGATAAVQRNLGLTLGAIAAVAAAGAWAIRRLLKRRAGSDGAPAERSRGERAKAIAIATISSAVVCGALHGALRGLGRALTANVSGAGTAAYASGAGIAIGAVFVAAVGAAFLAHARGPLPWMAHLGLVAAIYVGSSYPFSLPPDDLHYLGKISTFPPNKVMVVTTGGQAATYRVDQNGFREPFFQAEKQPGTIRIGTIGDSFVFGSGVEAPDTLAVRLSAELARRRPDRRFEVLNLGVAGNNLASHVDVYEEVTARFDLDAVVLGLTLVNDLSPFDGQAERREARRIGTFSFARYLLGDAANWLWFAVLDERTTTPRGLAHLDEQLARLARIRRAQGRRPALVLLTWGLVDPQIEDRLRAMEGVTRATVGPTTLEDFIPNDGHPTAAGNRRFAAWAADAIEADPGMQPLLSAPAP